ncbi:MAG: hypothetical protein JSW55_15820 [Chloroflexota bacterium]|nr:MAG: hypothetical protein JSW55_15820 [Chloroflexota bacterium]
MTHLTNMTRVRTLTTTRRMRVLPQAGQIVVPVGREVEPVHVVARGPAVSACAVWRASDVLGVAPEELEKHLLVEEGATLERGAPLMRRPATIGQAKVYRCPADGTLIRIRDGCLILRRSDRVEELRAMLSGRVVSIVPQRGVIIEAVGSVVQGVWDSGRSGVGKLVRSVHGADEKLKVEQVGPEAAGAVYVAGVFEDREALDRLEERSAHGLIAGSMPASLHARARESTIPIILTEGFGRRPMAEPIFELLQRSEGRDASLLAASHDYRTQRAEVIIPLPTSGSLPQVEPDAVVIEIGSLVRANGLDSGTTLGRVARVHGQPRRTAIGGLASGADVVLADGETVFVPYANLDHIG